MILAKQIFLRPLMNFAVPLLFWCVFCYFFVAWPGEDDCIVVVKSSEPKELRLSGI